MTEQIIEGGQPCSSPLVAAPYVRYAWRPGPTVLSLAQRITKALTVRDWRARHLRTPVFESKTNNFWVATLPVSQLSVICTRKMCLSASVILPVPHELATPQLLRLGLSPLFARVPGAQLRRRRFSLHDCGANLRR